MAASNTAQQRTAALSKAESARTTVNSGLSSGDYSDDLVAQVVPVAFKVVVVRNPASSLTEAEAEALAGTIGLEFYKES